MKFFSQDVKLSFTLLFELTNQRQNLHGAIYFFIMNLKRHDREHTTELKFNIDVS